MYTKAILFLTLPLLLAARDNPFLPALTENRTPLPLIKHTKTVQEPVGTEVVKVKKAPVQMETPVKRAQKRRILNYEKVRLVLTEHSVYIQTNDKMLKHFSIKNPPSIVIDFRSKADFSSKRETLSVGAVKKVEIGAHGDSYRVVLRLDKRHYYKISKKRYGQFLTIN